MIENLVSTVIPVHNRAAMLCEAVDSVLAQDWRPIEIVIVDDGSTDDTPAVADEIATTNTGVVRVMHQANSGPGVARQAGLAIAQGEFVQFLDSDDLLLPEKFSLQVAALRADPVAGICYGRTIASNDGVRETAYAQATGERHRKLFPAMLRDPLWPTLTPLYRRTVIDRIGPWPTGCQLEDWVYDAMAGALGIELCYVDADVAETRNHGGNRLCNSWLRDESALRDRASAHVAVLGYALQTGVAVGSAEMERFVRTLFYMARVVGARGLQDESRQLFNLARTNALKPGWDYRLFSWLAAITGFPHASRLAEAVMAFGNRIRS